MPEAAERPPDVYLRGHACSVPTPVQKTLPELQPAMHHPDGKVILVVEDDAEQRFLYAQVLQGAGYRVVEAADSATALSQVHEVRPDLVLMDVTLPGPSGWNATREIKSHPETHRVPVLVVTGLVAQADRDASYASGSDGYLEKPVAPQRLLQEVARMLADTGGHG